MNMVCPDCNRGLPLYGLKYVDRNLECTYPPCRSVFYMLYLGKKKDDEK